MAEATAKLSILVQLRDEASNAMRSLVNGVSDLGGSLGFAGDKAGILSGAFAALGGATILKSIGAFEEANLKLVTAQALLAKLPDGMAKFEAAVRAGNEMQRKFGFDNEEVTLSLAKFLSATGGDMPHAMQALEAAMGLAISKFGGPAGLASAADLVMRSFAGGGRILKEFGQNIGENESAISAIAKVAQFTAPYLDAWGQSTQKSGEVAKQFGADILESMGAPLAIAKDKLLQFITGSESTQAAIQRLQPFFGSLGVAITIMSTVLAVQALPRLAATIAGMLGIAGAAEITLGTIIAFTGVVLLWTLAIAAAILIAYLIITNWSEIKEFLIATWNRIKEMAAEIWERIIDFFRTLPERIGAIFGELVVKIVEWMQKLYKFFTDTIPALVGQIATWFAGLPDRVVSGLSSLPSKVYSLFSSAASSIKSIFQDVVNFVANAPNSIVDFGKNAINSFVDVVNRFVGSFNSVAGKVGITLPTIPRFAEGGIVTSPTIGLIGEAGPEAVIPLNRFRGGIGGGVVNVYLQGDFYTDAEVAEKWANTIARLINYQIRLA
ncbi:hypothetical protein K8R04_00115 [Candidatus Uhrbacteria bacterium]|nr:hypothetical protein [Candidatus Uhrbacteria bacterium]